MTTRTVLSPLSSNVQPVSKLSAPPKTWKTPLKELPSATRLPTPKAHGKPATNTYHVQELAATTATANVSPTTASRVAMGYLTSSASLNKPDDQAAQSAHALFEAELRFMNQRTACKDACSRVSELTHKLELAREATETSMCEVLIVQQALDDSQEATRLLSTQLAEAKVASNTITSLQDALEASKFAEAKLRTQLREVEERASASLKVAQEEAEEAKMLALDKAAALEQALADRESALERAEQEAHTGRLAATEAAEARAELTQIKKNLEGMMSEKEEAVGEVRQQLARMEADSEKAFLAEVSVLKEKAGDQLQTALRKAKHEWEGAQAKLLAELEARSYSAVCEARATAEAKAKAQTADKLRASRKAMARIEQQRAQKAERELTAAKAALSLSEEKEAAAVKKLAHLNSALNAAAAEQLIQVEALRHEKDNEISLLRDEIAASQEAAATAAAERQLLREAEFERLEELEQVRAALVQAEARVAQVEEEEAAEAARYEVVIGQLRSQLNESVRQRYEEQLLHDEVCDQLKEEVTRSAQADKEAAVQAMEAAHIIDLEALRVELTVDGRRRTAEAVADAVARKEVELMSAVDAAFETATEAKQVIDKLESELFLARKAAEKAAAERDDQAQVLRQIQEAFEEGEGGTEHEDTAADEEGASQLVVDHGSPVLSTPLMEARTRAKFHQRAARKARRQADNAVALLAVEIDRRSEAEGVAAHNLSTLERIQEQYANQIRAFTEAAHSRASALHKVMELAVEAGKCAMEAARRTKDGRAAEVLRFAAKSFRAHASVTAEVADAEAMIGEGITYSLVEGPKE